MARPAKHNKSWTKRDVALLREHYRKKTLHRVIAAQLKRTLNAVESKAMELGLSGSRGKKRKK
ncbi:MAG: hypothetical protein KGJ80_07020 [Chloroflexota bacterium]|nr:hypothetical protein [Chloroflexota bacterium]